MIFDECVFFVGLRSFHTVESTGWSVGNKDWGNLPIKKGSTGVLEIAQKAIEGCPCHMMAYAFNFELAHNSKLCGLNSEQTKHTS